MKNRSQSQRMARNRRSGLGLERLELRRLFAGLNVFVYADQDGSRRFESGAEQGAANRVVFVDLNGNSSFDVDDPVAISDASGVAHFPALDPGQFQIGLLNANPLQVQSSDVAPAPAARPDNSVVARSIIADADLTEVWAISSEGVATDVSPGASENSAFDLGGSLIATAESPSGRTFAVIEVRGAGRQLIEVNFADRSTRLVAVNGLAAASQLENIVFAGGALRLEVSGRQGAALLSLSESGRDFTVSQSVAVSSGKLVGNAASNVMYVVSTEPTGSRITRLELSSSGVVSEASRFSVPISEVAMSADGRLLFATRTAGGVDVYATGGIQAKLAELTEAAGPVSADSVDGRVVTTNRARPNELIVWDRETWLPIGRTTLSGTDAFGRPAAVRDLRTDVFGSGLTALTTAGVYSIELDRPTLVPVTVSNDSPAQAALGVRVLRDVASPPGNWQVNLRTTEDESKHADLRTLAADQAGSAVLFQLAGQAVHGQASVASDGSIDYTPTPDFFGSDTVVVEVLDGLTTSVMTVSLNVAPVNDAPRSLNVHMEPLHESAAFGAVVGQITVDDPDLDQDYQYVSSDPRFAVLGTTIVRTSDGELDYENGAHIPIVFTAYRPAESSDSITVTSVLDLIDVNEIPTGLHVNASGIPENTKGAVVGTVVVFDPDGHGEYQFSVSDSRFEVVAGVLKLRDDVALDYEAEPQVNLMLFVTDPTAGSGSDAVAGVANVDVLDGDDSSNAPFSIRASNLVVSGAGIAVGTFELVGGDPTAVYRWSVSDTRFRIEEKTLYTKSDAQFNSSSEPNITFTVTVADDRGRSVAPQFRANVAMSPPYQNPSNPLDVDNDGGVYPRDILILINEINTRGPRAIRPPASGEPNSPDMPPFPDVNGDGNISPIDILIIINHLNGPQSIAPEGEAFRPSNAVASSGQGFKSSVENDQSQEGPACAPYSNSSQSAGSELLLDRVWSGGINTWEIDQELEELLNELSFARRST